MYNKLFIIFCVRIKTKQNKTITTTTTRNNLLEKHQGYHCSSVETSLVWRWNVQVPEKIKQITIV